MIVTTNTKAIINDCVENYVPGGTHEFYHIDCQEHISKIVEVLIEKDLLLPDYEIIEEIISKHWEELIIKQLSLLN